MKILFLGTGAADYKIDQRVPGEEFRRYSSALITTDNGEKLLIDPGPHIFDYTEMNDCPDLFDGLTGIIVTHSHPDHFSPKNAVKLLEKYDADIYGDDAVLRKFIRENEKSGCTFNVSEKFHIIRKAEKVNIGGFIVMAVRSNHATGDPQEVTLNYCVFADGRSLFYGLDGAWMLKETYRLIREICFDTMVLEITVGDSPDDFRIFEHNNIAMAVMMKNMFLKNGVADAHTHFIGSHLARTLHRSHAEVAATLKQYDIDVAFDGMEAVI